MSSPRPSSGLARYIKDPYCGLSHAAGAVLSVVALVAMLHASEGGALRTTAICVYGASLILLFTASALAHSMYCSAKMGSRLDRFDYVAIFLLIAGTYTPLCLTVLRGPWGWSLLTIEWMTALIGVIFVLISDSIPRWTMLLYLPMGWLAFAAGAPILRLFPIDAIIYLLLGGLLYTVGAAVFITGRPKLLPGRFGAHDLWHTMVLLAAGCHLATIFRTSV